MALPVPGMEKAISDAIKRHMVAQENTIRELLSRWASGLSPVILYQRGGMQIVGVGIEDDPTGRVVVANPKYHRPLMDYFCA